MTKAKDRTPEPVPEGEGGPAVQPLPEDLNGDQPLSQELPEAVSTDTPLAQPMPEKVNFGQSGEQE